MTAPSLIPAGAATISACGRYRYRLTRTWGTAPPLMFVMLNPSTADASTDDPTSRRCVGFARREGAGGIAIVNLFALRATKPRTLLSSPDPFGPDNEQEIRRCTAETSGPIVAAWGADVLGGLTVATAAIVRGMLPADRLHCLGVTADGSPRHPSRLPSNAPLIPWPTA